jgi:putative ABC transport system permease protein
MTLLRRFASIVRGWLRPRQAEQELADDLQGFIDASTADKIRHGIAPAEARRLAMLELGGLEQAKERVRTSRHGAWLEEAGRDVRYGLRMIARYPGFHAVVVLMLTLGIGANTAIFSLIDALMLRALPVRSPETLVQVSIASADLDANPSLSYLIVGALAEQRDIFSGAAGFNTASFNVGPPGSIVRVSGALVTGAYYETLGLNPVAGRLLARDDDRPGAALVAVISYGYWERQFARRPDIAGQPVLLNGVPVSIAGVSPRGFVGADVGSIADITVPVAALPRIDPDNAALLGPGNFWLRVLARPKPDLSAEQAESRLAAAWPRISAPVIPPHWPASRRQELADARFRVSAGGTGWTYLRTQYSTALSVLMAVVGIVLLIACANVASLFMARASTRRREIALRLAIGASRGRVVRQLLIESALVSSIGALLGIGLAWTSGHVLVGMISTGPSPLVFDLRPNLRILSFTTVLTLVTTLGFGVAPALQATADGPAPVLKEDARMSRSRSRLLPSLVGAQVALSLVLLVGAGLFGRTLHNLRRSDSGFNPSDVLIVDLPARGLPPVSALLDAMHQVPGVLSASVSTHTPLGGSTWSEPAVPAGQPLPDRDTALFVGASERFFETMGIDLVSGRTFTDLDSAQGPAVAIVNERFAQRFFPQQTAIGQRLSASVRGQRRDLAIVGLVRNVTASSLRTTAPATVYLPYAQVLSNLPATLEIRVRRPHETALAAEQTLRTILPGAPIEVRPLAAQVSDTLLQERMMATLTSAFGLLALGLACVGLYGLLAYGVARRIKEIGIRVALGAQRRAVTRLVLWHGARPVLAGLAFGLPVAWLASRPLEALLFGLKPGDPAVVAGAAAALIVATLLAAYVPARLASRMDPLMALRHE